MTAIIQGTSFEDRVAALPPRRDPRSRVTTRKLMAKHEMRENTDLSWAEGDTEKTAPRCAGKVMAGELPDNAFFPTDRGDTTWKITRDTICTGCPVAQSCHDFGLRNEYVGLWGGIMITPDDIIKRRAVLIKLRREQRLRRLREQYPASALNA